MNSTRTSSNDKNHKLQPSGKSVSCHCVKASSCIELSDIRKLDSLLNQCESISCDNLLLYDEIYNYDLCATTKRKYVSTSVLHKIPPKNSIRRRTHKKVLGIRENDSKIIKLIDNKRQLDYCEKFQADLIKCSDKNKTKCEYEGLFSTHSCTNFFHRTSPNTVMTFCDKTIQTSYDDLCRQANNICKHLPTFRKHNKRKQNKRKQCSCRDYENSNFICETSLTTMPIIETVKTSSTSFWSMRNTPLRSAFQLRNDKSCDKSTSVKCKRFTKQKNTIIDDDDDDEYILGKNATNFFQDNRVININDKAAEIIPISLNSSYSQSLPLHGTNNIHHDTKSDRSKRSKFSPSFISRQLTSRLNSDEEGGVKESLLGRGKSSEKKLPEPVETVCIDDILSLVSCELQIIFYLFFSFIAFICFTCISWRTMSKSIASRHKRKNHITKTFNSSIV